MSFRQSFGQNEALNETQLPMFEQDIALPQSEGDLMTPHLHNLVLAEVRSPFEGA